MYVRDFMVRDVISARPTTSIKDVMATFVEKKIGGIPIVDENGILTGIVTDGDILRAIKPIDRRIHDYFSLITYVADEDMEERLGELANKEIIKIAKTHGILSLRPDDDLKTVVGLLSKHHFKKLPVVNEAGRVVGVVSRGDVIRNIQQTIISKWE